MSESQPPKVCYLDIIPELMVEVLKGFRWPANSKRRFQVTQNPLPDDAQCVGISYTPGAHCIRLHVSSIHFEQDGVSVEAPVIQVTSA